MKRKTTGLSGFALLMLAGGCATTPSPHMVDPVAVDALRDRAVEAIKRAVRYEHAGSVRALGIEVMQRRLGDDALPWLRNALHDEEPGVNFAALMALGTLRDRDSRERVAMLAEHENKVLRVAACFALHQMGDTRYSARLPELLLDDPSPEVRRSGAMVLGLLDEAKAVRLLARAMKDKDEYVRQEALESMARLGNPEAVSQLTFSASSGPGDRRVSAINTLAELEQPSLANTFRYKLQKGEYVETRLAAANALGRLGIDDGLKLALKHIDFNRPQENVAQDPPRLQIRRVRQLAANALGSIGDPAALPALEKRLSDQADPWIQVAAADAILGILGTGDPFGASAAAFRGRGAN